MGGLQSHTSCQWCGGVPPQLQMEEKRGPPVPVSATAKAQAGECQGLALQK